MQAMPESKILVVEDDASMCESMRSLLGVHGFDVHTSHTVQDARRTLMDRRFDLVLLDLKLDDQSGFAVMDHLKERALDTRIIVVTGLDSEQYAITALKKGAIDYLKKPVAPEALLASVNRELARLSRYRELRLFKDALSSASTAVVVSDPQGRIVYTNPAYEKLMHAGTPPGSADSARQHHDDDPRIDRQMRQTLETGRSWEGRVEIDDDRGRPIAVWKRVDAIVGAVRGETYGLALMYKMAASPTAGTGDEKFRNLAEMTSDWIWEVDGDGAYTYSNPVVEDLLGYRPDEIVGRTPFDFMPDADARRVKEIFQRALAAGETLNHVENLNRCKDGSIVTLETSAVPIVDAGGRVVGYRGIDRDISDRKRAADRLQQESEDLKQRLAGGNRLRGILHICAGCKMVRDEKGVWNDIETYIETHSDAAFSHGICPACARKLYPELYK